MTDHATMKRRAGELRRNQTSTERALWARLRMRNLSSVRFLRQHVVGNYIVDFYAPSLRLAIELDGGQHYETASLHYDALRTEWLQTHGVTVLRYTNLDVSQRLDDVLSDMERVVMRLKQHPPAPAARPPSAGRGRTGLETSIAPVKHPPGAGALAPRVHVVPGAGALALRARPLRPFLRKGEGICEAPLLSSPFRRKGD